MFMHFTLQTHWKKKTDLHGSWCRNWQCGFLFPQVKALINRLKLFFSKWLFNSVQTRTKSTEKTVHISENSFWPGLSHREDAQENLLGGRLFNPNHLLRKKCSSYLNARPLFFQLKPFVWRVVPSVVLERSCSYELGDWKHEYEVGLFFSSTANSYRCSGFDMQAVCWVCHAECTTIGTSVSRVKSGRRHL